MPILSVQHSELTGRAVPPREETLNRQPGPERLAVHDLVALDAAGGVPRIHYQLGLADDLLVVVVGVVGDDEHAIVLSEIVERGALHLQIVFAAATHER